MALAAVLAVLGCVLIATFSGLVFGPVTVLAVAGVELIVAAYVVAYLEAQSE